MIPLVKPLISRREIKEVESVLKSGNLAQGEKVKKLEVEFAKFCGTKYSAALNSGTAALHAALDSLGIGKGDEVIVPAMSFVASANCVLMVNATPVFADISEDDFCINPEEIEKRITKKTKAIITVDLYGQLCDYPKIKKITKDSNIRIIEDACQAHGAELNRQRAGSFGDAAAFSLYATKNITSGEGGMLTSNSKEIADAVKRFRHHGQNQKTFNCETLGFNYRMTDLQAAIALEQLKKINNFNQKRIRNAKLLNQALKDIDWIQTPIVRKGAKHVFHQYTVRVKKGRRNKLMKALQKNKIGFGIYYPLPIHLHPLYRKMDYKGRFPVAERAAKEVLSLPVNPSVTEKDIATIKKVIQSI